MCCRRVRETCRWRAVRIGTAAAEKRCGGRAVEGGRIVSQRPVAVDETAETGCAFATRQGLSWNRLIVARRSEPVQPSDTAPDRRSERKPEDAEESTAVETPRAARPACELACCREANLNRRETAAGAGTIGGHRVYLLDGMGARRREKKGKSGRKNQTVGGPRSTARAITV